MLQWNDVTWYPRAFWAATILSSATKGTATRRYMGPLPAAGQWVRLEVPASQVALEGRTLNGMAFSQFDGRATWDYAGKSYVSISNTNTSGGTNGNNGSGGSTNTNSGGSTNTNNGGSTNVVTGTIWVDDTVPFGASTASDGGDSWNWVSGNPAPFHGGLANQSSIGSGAHQH